MKLPIIGLLTCNSAGSNTGYLTGLAAIRIIREFGDRVGVCSLPAIANRVPRQMALMKKLKYLIVVDGCRNRCASKILSQLGISYHVYINLEDLGLKKFDPFTTLEYSQEEVEEVYRVLVAKVREILRKEGEL